MIFILCKKKQTLPNINRRWLSNFNKCRIDLKLNN